MANRLYPPSTKRRPRRKSSGRLNNEGEVGVAKLVDAAPRQCEGYVMLAMRGLQCGSGSAVVIDVCRGLGHNSAVVFVVAVVSQLCALALDE